jgi:arsenate reductase
MYKELSDYIESATAEMDAIPQERKKQLETVAEFIQSKKDSGETANLTFICTHNSRRSHLSQIWAAAAAAFYGIEQVVNTFSGGTEATAFYPSAVQAIERAGFQVQNPGGDNPHYEVSYEENGKVLECFSKKYDDPFNASEHFAAIMTCSHADEACPFIPGADLRMPVRYVDPKVSDGTNHEVATYDERCKQIATEMLFMMSQVEK